MADYILEHGSLSAMKLQRLVYYSQVWHLVWEDRPLFEEEIQASVCGCIVLALSERHRGHFKLEKKFFGGDQNCLTSENKEVIDKVIAYYGDRDVQWLNSLIKLEDPWINARRGNNKIRLEDMQEYYSGL